ncbi:MAG: tRNA preQ1(34) S-adenosylmethionine ribosyltransferase-isomerase QueA [Armatimonadia bacterium]
MLLSDFDYDLPHELIAQHPPAQRGQSRLLVIPRTGGPLQHRMFADLPDYLRGASALAPGDCLILNDTRVIPARLIGHRATGGQAELLLLRPVAPDTWEALARPARRLRPGDRLTFEAPQDDHRRTGVSPASGRRCAGVSPAAVITDQLSPEMGTEPSRATSPSPEPTNQPSRAGSVPISTTQPLLTAEIISTGLDGLRTVRLEYDGDLLNILDQVGRMPLPPYIHRDDPEAADKSRYQTVYAAQPGAVAAPTAGLHFTPELLSTIESRGVSIARLTLHVGLGTFRPITAERLEDHVMHSEWYSVSSSAAATINAARAGGGRLIAAGTTVVRTLETVADESGYLQPGEGQTDIFIKPGYTFRATDGMITNFHLPKSSLLVMVSAFIGRDRVLQAYNEAIANGYRFYSYGDATLVI